MLRIYRKISTLLFIDDLFVRVIIFITGLLIGAIPLAVVLYGGLANGHDSAIYILLVLLTTLAAFLLYSSTFGSKRLLDKAVDWANSGDLLFFLGLITFAIRITLLIRLYQNKNNKRDF